MQHVPFITEEKLHVHSDYAESSGLVPELVLRLIAASVPNPLEFRMASGGSVGQRGWDGILNSPTSFDPYIPDGQSFWEIGRGNDPKRKANEDFDKRTAQVTSEQQASAVFIFVTSRSANFGWNFDDQSAWIAEKKAASQWKDIRVIDGTKLVMWLYKFPGIDFWFAKRIGLPADGLFTPALHWDVLSSYGSPPPLKPGIFLLAREQAVASLLQVFEGQMNELRLETRYPEEGVDFVVAALASLETNQQLAYGGRCLIIDDKATWRTMCSLRSPHIFVATPSLDLESSGSDLRAQARAARHAVIFAANYSSGGHGNTFRLVESKPFELERELVGCGYVPERARHLAGKSGGRIVILKRLLLDLSASPDWAGNTEAAELRLAALIGRWDGNNENDRQIIEGFLGKAYGEWIETIRPMALRSDPPLTQRDEKWKFVSRFEGWQVLGPYLANADLKRFEQLALSVLKERHPKFDLPPEEHYMANVKGKIPKYSGQLREGIADTLALLGSYPQALQSASTGIAQQTADMIVRELLTDADWTLWASLQDVLPLLAEASPDEFLDAFENELDTPSPRILKLFSLERPGLFGGNFNTGTLWALETLAWNEEYLMRVSQTLARLATHDPGGNWINRPSNSLLTIFLPWFPQTTAPLEKRCSVIETLSHTYPAIAWKLLLKLLPDSHQITSGGYKPVWRQWINQDRQEGTTNREYVLQIERYADLAITLSENDLQRLNDLIDHVGDLPPVPQNRLLEYLGSEKIQSLIETVRLPIWQSLVELVAKHRRYAESDWAMDEVLAAKIEGVAELLNPKSLEGKYQRQFADRDFDLMDDFSGDYEQKKKLLQERRQNAVSEILSAGGLEAIFRFSESVQAPWQVGQCLGIVGGKNIDEKVLPENLISQNKSLTEFGMGFVWGRFASLGWEWVTNVNVEAWASNAKAAFLINLPFNKKTWDLAVRLLGDDKTAYWTKTSANIYQSDKSDYPEAIDNLLKAGRVDAALFCLNRALEDNTPFDIDLVVKVLQRVLKITDSNSFPDSHNILHAIRWLQKNTAVDVKVIQGLEWAFLPLLDRHHGASPKFLERWLASDPGFFCEVIRAVFRGKSEEPPTERSDSEKANAQNAYRLLTSWRTPPGCQSGSEFRATELKEWVEQVKKLSQETGHSSVALSRVGHVLAYVPADPSGLWINHAVATVLNAPDAEDMRDGFRLELFNSRGVHGFTLGRDEQVLAAKYKKQAEEIESTYPRLATTIRRLSKWYESDAEREAARDPYDD